MIGVSICLKVQAGFPAAAVLASLLPQTRLCIEAAGKNLRDIVKAGAGFGPSRPGHRLIFTSQGDGGEISYYVHMNVQGGAARLESSAFQLAGENLACTSRCILGPDRPQTRLVIGAGWVERSEEHT